MAADDQTLDALMKQLARAPVVAPPLPFQGTERYGLLRSLGEGGFGVVYEAEDRVQGGRLALKLLRVPSGDALYRFKREFRTLSAIHHPNLARLFELGSHGDHWFFTMELVEGAPFDAYLRSAPGQVRQIVAQVARALVEVHAAGKLHRDLKPANVLVDGGGRAVLLDFGLAADLEGQSTVELAGTPIYMSPEQSVGQPLTAASDWYSLGVMLYEVLAGRPPLSGSFFELQRDKLRLDPPPLPEEAPPDLAQLCLRLLARDAAARPGGDEVLSLMEGHTVLPRAAPAELFLGREAELAALREALRAAPAIRFVHGSSGGGKSALLARFCAQAEALVLSGRCLEQESLPYKALDSLVDALTRRLLRMTELECEGLMPRHAGALARLFPVLRQLPAVERRRQTSGDAAEIRRLGVSALRELLLRLCDRGPVVLVVDDLQWGDADSGALLAEILRPPEPPPLLFLGAFRSEDRAGSAFLRTFAERGEPAPELALRPLPPEEATQLAERRLAELGSDGAAAAAIAADSRGSPFFVSELVRRFAAGAAPCGDVTALVQERAAALPEPERRLLSAVAVGGSLPLPVAGAAAQLSGDSLRRTLSSLEWQRFLRTAAVHGGTRLECYHDRIREAVAAQVAGEPRRALCLALAQALVQQPSPDAEAVAANFLAAGESGRAAPWLERAADAACEALAYDHAARLMRTLLELRAPAAAELPLRCKLAEALAQAGRIVEAAAAFQAAAELASGPQALELRVRAAHELMLGGHIERGSDLFGRSLAGLGVKLPRSRPGLIAKLLAGRARLKLRGLGFVERSDLPAADRDRLGLMWAAISGFAVTQPLIAAALMPDFLRRALDSGDAATIVRGLCGLVMNHSFQKGTAGEPLVRGTLEQARALVERLEQPGHDAMVRMAAGVAASNCDAYREAVPLLGQAAEIARGRGGAVDTSVHRAQLFFYYAQATRGRSREPCLELPGYIADLQERGNLTGAVFMSVNLALAELAQGRSDESRLRLEHALAQWPEKGADLPRRIGALISAQRRLYDEGGAKAWEAWSRDWPWLKSGHRFVSRSTWVRILHQRAATALACAAEQPRRAPELLSGIDGDLSRMAAEATQAAAPLAAALQARRASLLGQPERAAALLGEAVTGLDVSGYEALAAAARRRRGELLGGEAGRALIAEADGWMAAEKIADPARWTATLLP